jgi:DNA-binding HxlR family transcriptional regulator
MPTKLTRQQTAEAQWDRTCPAPEGLRCPVRTTTNLIGGKWKLLLLAFLADGARRYGELRRLVPEISEKMLIQELRSLETDGLVSRTVYQMVPPRVEYQLVGPGVELKPVVAALLNWGMAYVNRK